MAGSANAPTARTFGPNDIAGAPTAQPLGGVETSRGPSMGGGFKAAVPAVMLNPGERFTFDDSGKYAGITNTADGGIDFSMANTRDVATNQPTRGGFVGNNNAASNGLIQMSQSYAASDGNYGHMFNPETGQITQKPGGRGSYDKKPNVWNVGDEGYQQLMDNYQQNNPNAQSLAINQPAQPTQGGKGGGNVAQPTPQPAPYTPANTGPTAQQPNINTQSAQGITSAMQGAQQEMGYRPQQVRVPGTSATIGGVNQSTRIGDPGQSGTIGGVNQSAQVQAGQLSGTNFDPYMNPYTDAVIKSTEGDILRGGEKALTGLGSQASSAGAFGGSRHGIAMGEMGRNITEQMAKSATGLRQANFQQAQQAAQQDIASRMQAGLANQRASQFDIGNVRQQQLANQQASQFDIGNRLKAGQLNQQASQFDIGNVRQAQLANQQAGMKDIQNLMQAQQLNQMAGLQGSQNRLGASQQLGNLANLGFGMGQTVQGNLAQQGTQQQAMMQALIDAAKGQYGGYTGHPAQGLGYVTQALGATGTPTSTTESSSPGLFGYLTAASQIPGLFPSDRRLKKNITKMGQLKSGLNIYKWEWIDGAKELGADMNHTLGVIAQEVKELFPNAVVKMDNGYYAVNYSALR